MPGCTYGAVITSRISKVHAATAAANWGYRPSSLDAFGCGRGCAALQFDGRVDDAGCGR